MAEQVWSSKTPTEVAELQVGCCNGLDQIVDGYFQERIPVFPGNFFSLKVEEVVYHGKSKYQDLLFFRSTDHGMIFCLDGVIQCCEHDEHSYQEMIAHLPLFAHGAAKKVLVIGGGDGGVLREICRHSSVEQVTICEIDEDVPKYSKMYLPSMACGYDDPRVTVFIGDGVEYLRNIPPGTIDVIITDSSDPIGPAAQLFEAPFYRSMHTALAEGGIICTQGECMWRDNKLIGTIVKKVQEFCSSVEYAYTTIPTYTNGCIGFIIASKGRETCKVPAKVDVEMEKSLKYYNSELHRAAFVLPSFVRRGIFE